MDRAELVAHARASIQRGSKSFAMASHLFDPETRERVWLLYAWCRACDDLIDGQDHGGAMAEQQNAAESLATVRALTARAFAGEPTGNPSFDALGQVARECGITPTMAGDVIAGFELDVAGWSPRSEADLLRYCFHVAGAVGVMMAVVMGVSPQDEDTLDRACDLGIAFQLANVARDIDEDALAGRCYLPGEWLAEAAIAQGDLMAPGNRRALALLARRLCDLERIYEASARTGAARLAFRQRWAVLSAAGIYGAIAREVERLEGRAWDRRVSTGALAKLGHVVRALARAAIPPRADVAHPALSRRQLQALAR